MDSVHKNFYLAPDLKKIKPKKVANYQNINLAPKYFFVFFCQKKDQKIYDAKLIF